MSRRHALSPCLPGLLAASLLLGALPARAVDENAGNKAPVKVVAPAATSGLAAAYILGISRAVGETMILAVSAGMQPNLTWNPLEPAATITAYIVQVALGDLPHGSVGYQTIFAAGLTLMLITLFFNVIGHIMRKKFREAY